MQWETISESETETLSSGEKLAGYLKRGDIVALSGQVGSGKTVFVKGVCRALRVSPETVHSPTFIIMNVYEGRLNSEKLPVRHFDFYRLATEKDFGEFGLDDWLDDAESVKLIEWSEHIRSHIPGRHWAVSMEPLQDTRRHIKIELTNDDSGN